MVVAVPRLVFLPHNGELVEDVGHGIAGRGKVTFERCQLLRRLVRGRAFLASRLLPGPIRVAWQVEVKNAASSSQRILKRRASSQENGGP